MPRELPRLIHFVRCSYQSLPRADADQYLARNGCNQRDDLAVCARQRPGWRPGLLRLAWPRWSVEPRAELESRELPVWLSGRPLAHALDVRHSWLRDDGAL